MDGETTRPDSIEAAPSLAPSAVPSSTSARSAVPGRSAVSGRTSGRLLPAPPPASRAASAVPYLVAGALAVGSAWLFEAERARRRELGTERTAREAAARQADVAAAEVRSLKERVEAQQGDLRLAEKKLAEAVSRGSSDLDRVLAEKAASERRTAELADRLGEAEAARLKAEKHARELDEVMDLLAKKKVNVRRLAGLDPPPRIEVEVVAADEKKVPPVLVLRLPEDATGLEEGDRLYLLRREGGRAREVGQALVERIDRAKGLISARIARLDAGERAAVGDRLSTYQP